MGKGEENNRTRAAYEWGPRMTSRLVQNRKPRQAQLAAKGITCIATTVFSCLSDGAVYANYLPRSLE